MSTKTDSKFIEFYLKHRLDYSRLRCMLAYLDVLSNSDITPENVFEFESLFDCVMLDFDDLSSQLNKIIDG